MLSNPFAAMFASVLALVAPSQQARFEACLTGAAVHEHASAILAHNGAAAAGSKADFWDFSEDSWLAYCRPYLIVDGVLQIPVKGVLLNNFPYAMGSWATGYEYLVQAYMRGMGDANVRGIALVIDSPGGHVAGCFDAVDKMVARRSDKPVEAFAAESAYSAAYAIATVASKITVSRSGGVGSIGVVTSHLDQSVALDKAGIKITFIYAGKHKVDGNSTEPLPDDVKANIQARIDESYDVFVAAVARNRGLEEQAVRDTEAQLFTASQAVSNGLADAIGSLDDAVSAFADNLTTTTQGNQA